MSRVLMLTGIMVDIFIRSCQRGQTRESRGIALTPRTTNRNSPPKNTIDPKSLAREAGIPMPARNCAILFASSFTNDTISTTASVPASRMPANFWFGIVFTFVAGNIKLR